MCQVLEPATVRPVRIRVQEDLIFILLKANHTINMVEALTIGPGVDHPATLGTIPLGLKFWDRGFSSCSIVQT